MAVLATWFEPLVVAGVAVASNFVVVAVGGAVLLVTVVVTVVVVVDALGAGAPRKGFCPACRDIHSAFCCRVVVVVAVFVVVAAAAVVVVVVIFVPSLFEQGGWLAFSFHDLSKVRQFPLELWRSSPSLLLGLWRVSPSLLQFSQPTRCISRPFC